MTGSCKMSSGRSVTLKLSTRQIKVLQIVFDQLCCDHFRDQVSNPPYNFKDEEDEFVNLLTIFEKKLEEIG